MKRSTPSLQGAIDMQVLLDTQTFYLATTGGALPKKVLSLLANDETERSISAITIIEIAIKHNLGKMRMDDKLVRQGTVDLRATIVPFTPQHALPHVRAAAALPRSVRSHDHCDGSNRRHSIDRRRSRVQKIQGPESDLVTKPHRLSPKSTLPT